MATKADKKNAIRQDIIDSAAIYSQSLAGKAFLYVYGEDFFEVSFPVDHFLHLTGVETKLSAKDFYKNAKKAKLTNSQFYFDARHPYANARKKLPCLKRIQMPKVTPHVCRHTFCSKMAKSGMNPKSLQYIMGHADISVTLNTYTHVKFEDAEAEMKRVAAI